MTSPPVTSPTAAPATTPADDPDDADAVADAVDPRRARARGAMRGLALGDSLGMPSQTLSPAAIVASYGTITGLVAATPDHRISQGLPAGSVTDDTEQAVIVARLLIEGHGRLEPLPLAEALLEWEETMRAQGSLDLLGPSTKGALEQVRAGADPTTTGRLGTTNGAAMRVTPVGVATPTDDVERFVRAVHESCMVTHDTRQGFESAALVAAAVSLAIDGAGAVEAVEGAVALLTRLEEEDRVPGAWSAKADVMARVRLALEQAPEPDATSRHAALQRYLRDTVGTSLESSESVAVALVLARDFADAPWEGLLLATNLGGDTDTFGAIAGAILGAASPESLPQDALATIESVSGLDLDDLADRLVVLRDRP